MIGCYNMLMRRQIKKTSSLILALSGIPKSMLLSSVDMVVYRTLLSGQKVLGFSIAAVGTYTYSQISNPIRLSEVIRKHFSVFKLFQLRTTHLTCLSNMLQEQLRVESSNITTTDSSIC